MTTKRADYKGHPMIVLAQENDKFPFQFGLHKAKLILAAIDDIRKFVQEEDSKATTASQATR